MVVGNDEYSPLSITSKQGRNFIGAMLRIALWAHPMNLGHALGAAVREAVREPDHPRGYWHQIGSTTVERVRTMVQTLDPVRYEVWQTHADERTCPTCGALDSQVWPADDGFTPPIHDNCRCQRVYHHTEFRSRLIEQWQDVAVPRISWEWRRV